MRVAARALGMLAALTLGATVGLVTSSSNAGASAPSTYHGYWEVASDGGVFSFGSAAFHGSMGGKHLNAPVVGMASDSATGGYWLVAADGGVFSFDAPFYGSMGGKHLNAPIAGMAATATGGGYWLVASDGGIFTFGNAPFYGSMGGKHLDAPVAGMEATTHKGANTHGYALVARTGGIFTFGGAHFRGSCTATGHGTAKDPFVGIVDTSNLIESDGYEGAPGSLHGCVAFHEVTSDDIVGATPTDNEGNTGFWWAAATGRVLGTKTKSVHTYGTMGGKHLNAPIVGIAATTR